MMRFGDRLGLRRSPLPKVNRGPNDHCDGEKLALPVLERLEPELRSAEILQCRDGVTAMRQFLIAVILGAADCMADDGAEEQNEEERRQRVLVRGQHPAALAYRPRSTRTVRRPARVFVLRRRLVNGLRLRGPTLEQIGGQYDVHAHLQELALPVLKGRFIERPGEQIATKGDRLLPVLELLGVIDPNAGQHHATEEDHETVPD